MSIIKSLFAAGLVLACSSAFAQVPPKLDGKWRATFGAGLSATSGNTSSRLFNMTGDLVKATPTDKWNFYGSQILGKSGGATTADLFNLGGRFNQDLNTQWFWFGQGDLTRNKLANLSMRTAMAGGLGYHVVKTEAMLFDVFGGLGYAHDSYVNSIQVAGSVRSSYGRMELLIGEESTHRLTSTTAFKQRLIVYPNMNDRGEFRAVFDAGISVAMSSTLSLTATLGVRHNSDPGTGLKSTDTMLFTGVSYKLD